MTQASDAVPAPDTCQPISIRPGNQVPLFLKMRSREVHSLFCPRPLPPRAAFLILKTRAMMCSIPSHGACIACRSCGHRATRKQRTSNPAPFAVLQRVTLTWCYAIPATGHTTCSVCTPDGLWYPMERGTAINAMKRIPTSTNSAAATRSCLRGVEIRTTQI